MASVITIGATIRVPFGFSNRDTIYLRNPSTGDELEFDNWASYRFIKKLNQMSSFEIRFVGVEASDRTTYIKEGNEVKFFYENTLQYKGRIGRVEYEQDFYATIKGFGMEVKLSDWNVTRKEFVNIPTTAIVTALISEGEDGSSPWIMNSGVNTNWGSITLKGEYDNRLRYLATAAKTINFDWWASQRVGGEEEGGTYDSGFPFNTDYFHLDNRKGSTASVKTLNTGGTSQNCDLVKREVDEENMTNYVYVLGYGGGINQIKTSVYNASSTHSTLAEVCASGDITITAISTTGFSAGDTIRIAEEQITVGSISTSCFTTCTRAANSTTAEAHPKGCFVEEHITVANAETDSSIGDYGLKQHTIEDRGLINDSAAQALASRTLLDYKDPINRFFVRMLDIGFTGVVVGDNVTLTDSDLGISSQSYRTVGIERGNTMEDGEYLIYELSNQGISVMEDLVGTDRKADVESKYAMGTTVSENLSEKENIDIDTDLNMRFYLPSEIIKMNKALLSYKIENFRGYTKSLSANATHTHALTGILVPSSDTTEYSSKNISVYNPPAFLNTASVIEWISTTVPSAAQGVFNGCVVSIALYNKTGASDDYSFFLWNTTTSATLASIVNQTIADNYGKEYSYNLSTAVVSVADNLQLRIYDGIVGSATAKVRQGYISIIIQTNATHTHDFTGETTDAGTSHSHTQIHGIYDDDAPVSQWLTVSVGPEGSELIAYSSNSTNVAVTDISTFLADSYNDNGAGWYNISFNGNATMRVEANCFLKYFIESK